jgi:hypothetical protein
MRSKGKRILGGLAWAALSVAAGHSGSIALAAGGMDPSYREVVAEPVRAVGRSVAWSMRLASVDKRFYTYTLRGAYVPAPGEGACDACLLVVTYRGRPDEVTRPARFHAGQLVRVRGTVIKLKPQLTVIAGLVEADYTGSH